MIKGYLPAQSSTVVPPLSSNLHQAMGISPGTASGVKSTERFTPTKSPEVVVRSNSSWMVVPSETDMLRTAFGPPLPCARLIGLAREKASPLSICPLVSNV
ncbi:MAG: hypothetical protein HY287_09430 [Planctomycetes bacterium]|nr:hypothetical protein [Planctomycetota bacterium]